MQCSRRCKHSGASSLFAWTRPPACQSIFWPLPVCPTQMLDAKGHFNFVWCFQCCHNFCSFLAVMIASILINDKRSHIVQKIGHTWFLVWFCKTEILRLNIRPQSILTVIRALFCCCRLLVVANIICPDFPAVGVISEVLTSCQKRTMDCSSVRGMGQSAAVRALWSIFHGNRIQNGNPLSSLPSNYLFSSWRAAPRRFWMI